MRKGTICGLAAAVLVVSGASAQCTLLVRETFRLGERLHGANGRLRDARVHDGLNDYWPEIPAGSRWMTNDRSGVPGWAFAASSTDPAEIDPLDEFNGTAFGEPGGVALIPFAPEPGAIAVSAEAVMLQNSTSATYLGFTSSPSLLFNYETHGTLWMSLNGRGEWAILANGSQVVASGQAPLAGTLDSGWLHMEFTYDPGSSTVSGRVMNTPIPPAPVTLTRAIAYVGMEAHESWNVLNNLTVRSGVAPRVVASGPQSACEGGPITLTAETNVTEPAMIFWVDSFGWPLADGPRPDASVVSGSRTSTLTISNLSAQDPGSYACTAANQCGLASSSAVWFVVGACGSCPADFNQDGGIDGADVEAFFAAWEIGDSSADINADGGVDGSDVADFFSRWEQGAC